MSTAAAAAERSVVVITGGAGDIGRALARAWVERGAHVALLDVDGSRLAAARDDVGPHDRVLAVECDVTDHAACEAAVARVIDRWGGIDVLVNNAGLSHRSLFADTDLAVLRRVVEVNLFGAIHCTRAALEHVRRRRGTLVAISSVAGYAPLVGRTGYAASKHALHGFFDSLRTEIERDGVGVLIVCPAFVDTGFAGRALDGGGGVLSGPRALAGRALTPDRVAQAVVDAVRRRRRRRLISPVAHASLWLSRLVPSLYDRAMRRSQREEFD